VAAAVGEATNEAEVTEDAEDQAEEGAVTTDIRCPCYTTFYGCNLEQFPAV
jgi:hypothetical protein